MTAKTPAHAPLRNEQPWRYCGKCGRQMEWRGRAEKAFSRVTGQPTTVFSWCCPRWALSDEGKAHDAAGRTFAADET